MKVYDPNKPHKWVLNVWTLTDSKRESKLVWIIELLWIRSLFIPKNHHGPAAGKRLIFAGGGGGLSRLRHVIIMISLCIGL